MNDEQTRTRFESLLLPLTNDAYNLARWLMKNQEDAEDMVQESYRREVAALVYQRDYMLLTCLSGLWNLAGTQPRKVSRRMATMFRIGNVMDSHSGLSPT